jgi:cysteine desulfurase / selenocysteine lyase
MSTAADYQLDATRLRADFPILATCVHGQKPLVYLDNAASTQRPRQVIDALVDVYEHAYANVHRSAHYLAAMANERYEDAREAARRFVNARSTNEVIFTSGTTAGVNLVARAWGDANLRAGDEILLTIAEHHSNIVPWQQLAERTGASVKFAPVSEDGQTVLEAFAELLSERTRLVAVASVSNVLGTIHPLVEIERLTHAAGALLFVDAAQSVPHMTTDVQTLNADFLAFSGHKMLGPSGIGILYGKEKLLDAMPPFLGGGSMINTVTTEGFTNARLPAKFEAGTPPIANAIALGAAIAYVEQVGLERIHAHELALTTYAHELMADLPGLRILGPAPELKGGLVSFAIEGVAAMDIAEIVDQQGVAIRAGHHCAMPLHARYGLSATARASFYLYNTREEVETFVMALRQAIRMLKR